MQRAPYGLTPLLLCRIPDNVDLFVRVDQFEPFPNLQFLFAWILREALDVLAFTLYLPREIGVALLHLLDLALLLNEGGNSLWPAQRYKGIAGDCKECDDVCESGDRRFHATTGLEHNSNIASLIRFAVFLR
jgi:hypothetical protein